MSQQASKLSKDVEQLRNRGQRMTPQRLAVLEVMQSSRGHVTVEYVMQQTDELGHSVSIASTYRILSWLREHGLVSITDVGERDMVFEYLGHGRHHHLICWKCETQIDVPYDLFTPLIGSIRDLYGFEARIEHQAVFGLCHKCASGSRSDANDPAVRGTHHGHHLH